VDDPAERFGAPVAPDALVSAKAKSLAAFLVARDDVGCGLVECRQAEGYSWLLVEVQVDVGQLPAADIHRRETLALGFPTDDRAWPSVRALRRDFPQPLPHEFLVPEGEPAALCLSEAPWEDAKRRWSDGGYVRLLRTWLIDTARGALHREDQALEPFLAGSPAVLILPADFQADPRRTVYGQPIGGPVETLIYRLGYTPPQGLGAKIVAAGIALPPRVQSGLRHTPRTLADLRVTFASEGFDFDAALDEAIGAWLDKKEHLDAVGVLLVQAPISRTPEGPVERHDLWAFGLGDDVRQAAIARDLWSTEGGGGRVLAMSRQGPKGEENVELAVMNPIFDLSAQSAAIASGYAGPSGKTLVAVGAGALGSQVLANLLRMGEALRAVADNDRLLPHNLARHAVWDYQLVGAPKATALQLMAQRRFPGAAAPKVLIVDASDPHGDEAVAYAESLGGADIVLDFAASVPVSRHLAIDATGAARRISAFLSPNGCDLVILAEDAARDVRLDHLELSYYRAVAENPALADHFALPPTTRYARGCREVSAQLPQALVAVHAGVAAGVIRNLVDGDEAFAAVWHLDDATFEVRRVDLDLRPMLTMPSAGWTVHIAEDLIARLYALREAHLPAETGGVLLGDFDTTRRRVYLAMTLGSPPDSTEEVTGYVRGAFGVAEAVQGVQARTLDMLRYVGEWHSHPKGSSALPSGEDLSLYGHLSDEMAVEGYPPVMMIVAEGHFSVLVDGVPAEIAPEPH
jgi:hypothetical protein